MRQLKKIISEFSLTQQLISIVVFTLLFFTVFFFGSLSFSIDRFVDQQMFDLVNASQQNVVYSYRIGVNPPELFGVQDPNIVHVILTREGNFITNNERGISNDLMDQVKRRLLMPSQGEPQDYYGLDQTIYTISDIESMHARIATVITRKYKAEFKRLLIQNVVNIMVILMGIVLLMLLVWVSMIIHPLNQVRDYINKIRRGESAELKINRKDEIGELARVLVEMNEELERQEIIKEEMIQNISHDLKTPIATIKSYAESIKDGVYPYQTLDKSVDVIIEHADRLEKKVFNLLMLNRMDYMSQDRTQDAHTFNMEDVVEQVIVSSIVIRPDVDIDLKSTPNATMFGTVEPWRIVIENLVDNALRFAKSRVEIQLKDDEIHVYNDGSTIDESSIQSIFKAYEKGDGGQFGLGLAIVHRVVTNFGYTIKAENVDDGVKFTIKRGETHGMEK